MIPLPKRKKLKRILLKINGNGVLFPPEDPDIGIIIKYGFLFDRDLKVVYKKMKMFDCHGNSSKIFIKDPDRYFICVGYALDTDGEDEEIFWRSHTWILDHIENKIIETTELRSLYFGVELSRESSFDFANVEAHYYDS